MIQQEKVSVGGTGFEPRHRFHRKSMISCENALAQTNMVVLWILWQKVMRLMTFDERFILEQKYKVKDNGKKVVLEYLGQL